MISHRGDYIRVKVNHVNCNRIFFFYINNKKKRMNLKTKHTTNENAIALQCHRFVKIQSFQKSECTHSFLTDRGKGTDQITCEHILWFREDWIENEVK